MDVHAGNKKAIVITPCLYMVHIRMWLVNSSHCIRKSYKFQENIRRRHNSYSLPRQNSLDLLWEVLGDRGKRENTSFICFLQAYRNERRSLCPYDWIGSSYSLWMEVWACPYTALITREDIISYYLPFWPAPIPGHTTVAFLSYTFFAWDPKKRSNWNKVHKRGTWFSSSMIFLTFHQ